MNPIQGFFECLVFKNPPIPLMAHVGGKQGIMGKMNLSSVLSEANVTLGQIPYGYIKEKNDLKLISIGKIHQALEGCACPMGGIEP